MVQVSILNQVIKNKKGILLIDKPQGWTSFDVVAKLRGVTGVKKIGHAGTLDPLATGLLIVLVGKEFTKLQNKFLELNKTYICKAKLGIETDSYDITGKIVAQKFVGMLHATSLRKILKKFQGEITQTVPAFSAVKVRGQKLYNLARKNKKIKILPKKIVNIEKMKLIKFSSPYFTIKTQVSSGTYIRSLIHDIGQELGTGATVIELKRTKIGEFDIKKAIDFVKYLALN